jgi:hypothetical protein
MELENGTKSQNKFTSRESQNILKVQNIVEKDGKTI